MLSVLLFQFIGFQYSAYIAGEVRGNVRRGVLIALIGALVIGVLANSVYVDAISSHFGFNTQRQLGRAATGASTRACRALPLGQPNSMPLLAVVANKSLWPIWALISLGGVDLPVPAVPGLHQLHQPDAARVEPRPPAAGVVRAASTSGCVRPLNAILATLGLTALFLFFQSYKDAADVPGDDRPQAQPRRHGVVLDRDGGADLDACRASTRCSCACAGPTWSATRRSASSCRGSALAWLVFPLWIYIFAVVKPIVNALKGGGALTYLETNGIIDAGIFYLLGIVIYFVMQLPHAVAAGVDAKMLFTELPPD